MRQSDVQRALNFKGIEHMARPPDAIVLLDSTSLHGEPAAANIPVIGVVDTDGPARDVDYPIPANANSVRFYHTYSTMPFHHYLTLCRSLQVEREWCRLERVQDAAGPTTASLGTCCERAALWCGWW